MEIERTKEEIHKQIDACEESDMSGMSYEDGVKYALEWVLGNDEMPIEVNDD